jgi:hypothetical protein
MPYYVYEMTSPKGMNLVKNLKLINEFETFKQAKQFAREQRDQLSDEDVTIKIMFADNQLLAEEQLLEHRDKPILMEHEK